MNQLDTLKKIDRLSAAEIESILSGQLHYLNKIVQQNYGMGKTVVQVRFNPDQKLRKAIYNLLLSDQTQIILKLCLKRLKSYVRELKGFELIKSSHIPGPELIFHDRCFSESLQVPFFLMNLVERKPYAAFFAGQIAEEDFNRELDSNPELWVFFFRKIIDAVHLLHQSDVTSSNYHYHPRMMKHLFRWYEQKIEVYREKSEQLSDPLRKIFQYYEERRHIFQQAPIYHVHGDLDLSNLIFTNSGVVPLDWENYHRGDCAEDIAYLLERYPGNRALKMRYLTIVIELYSKQDPYFACRLKFQTALTKLWHVLEKGKSVADFLQFVNNQLNH